jgi:hypothetical protein
MFDYDTFSDLHKDVHGFRPSEIFMKNVKRFSNQERDDLWEALCAQLEENTKAEKAQEEVDIAKFEARIQDVIELGAGNRFNALLWIIGTETFYHIQDVEHFVWEQGILFTDYGKQLVKDLAEIVEYKEYDYE